MPLSKAALPVQSNMCVRVSQTISNNKLAERCLLVGNSETVNRLHTDWDPGEETNLSLRKEAPALESRRRFNDKFGVFVKPPWAINRHLITEIEVF